MSIEDHDERSLDIFNKFFFFLNTPHLVDKQFIEDLLNSLDAYFKDSDDYSSSKSKKDKNIDDLNIDKISSSFTTGTNKVNNRTDNLRDLEESLEEWATKCSNAYSQLKSNLDTILSEQESYKWFVR